MRMRLITLVIAGLIAAPLPRDAGAEQVDANKARTPLALVIGNAKYPDSDAPLKEPVNDARALAEELRRDGFEVDVAENFAKEAMQRALVRLYDRIGSGSIALLFFSGYAIQSNRQSYMIPVDAQIWTEADVRRDAFSLDAALAEMNMRGASVKVAILDASRRNPFERRFRSFSAGLAPVVAPTGTLVMYAAAPSTVVGDSTSEQGLFVGELIKQMRVTGATAEEVFNRTRMGVSRATQGEQVPWFSSSLGEDYAFGQAPRPAVAAAPEPPAPVVPSAPESKLAATPIIEQVANAESAASVPTALLSAPTSSLPVPAPLPAAPQSAPAPTVAKADDPAIKDLDQRISLNPHDGAAFYKRGQLYAKNGDFPRAIKDFDEAIRLNPKDAEALNNRCWTHAINGDLQAAMKDCNEALQIRPRYADALDSRGLVSLKLGLSANAIADYDAVLQSNPKQASSLYGRGIARLRIGNKTEGDSDIAAAKAINPGIAEEFAGYGVR